MIGLGAAYGTAKSGVGLSAMGVLRPDLVLKCIVPVVMAGILGIYGVVVSVLLSSGCKCDAKYILQGKKIDNAFYCIVAMKQTLFSGFIQFGAGLSVGLSCVSGSIAIKVVHYSYSCLFSHSWLLVLLLVLLVMLVFVLLLNNQECLSAW